MRKIDFEQGVDQSKRVETAKKQKSAREELLPTSIVIVPHNRSKPHKQNVQVMQRNKTITNANRGLKRLERRKKILF